MFDPSRVCHNTAKSGAPRLLGGAGNEEDMVMLDRDAVEKILPEAHEARAGPRDFTSNKNGGLSTKNGDLSMKHGRIMHISYIISIQIYRMWCPIVG